MRFEDKVVLITGGAVGLGRACARAFAAEGAATVIADVDDHKADDVVSALRSTGARAMAVHCDVADEAQVEEAVGNAVAELGGVDVVVNNAALHLMKYNRPFSMLSRDEVRRLFDVNVIGIVNCTLACRDSMRARGGGSVVNVSSTSSQMCISPYAVSKLAVRGLSVALARELAPDGIRVNTVAPGLMDTENAMADMPPNVIDDRVARQLIPRLGTMGDVAAAILFLCSEDAGFVTGETMNVCGGWPLSP